MIDDYQDINLIQAELVRMLAWSHESVMAAGDDAKSSAVLFHWLSG
jgi:DNA helicase-2/ATP-dependent DNA helicase PcrA